MEKNTKGIKAFLLATITNIIANIYCHCNNESPQKVKLLKNTVGYQAILCILLLTFTLPILSNVASAGTSDFRFIAWADTKTGTSILTQESKLVNGLNPNFTIYPGDLIDCSSSTNPTCFANGFFTWKTAFNGGGANDLFDKSFVTRGNHDANSDSAWLADFNFSAVSTSIGATHYSEQTPEMTYSFDYGNSHFVGIDLPGGDVSTMTSAEITWLDNDLTAAENRGLTHAFLFWHGPIYYVDGHPSTPSASLINVLNKHPIISATFHGHEHLVTYTHMDSSRISTITHPFEEFISGGAGASLYQATAGRYDYWLNSGGSSEFGFVAVDVSGSYFNISVYNVDGFLDKTFSFTHGAASVSTPTFSPPEGNYSSTQTVSISTATPGATIHYTTDGTTPTESSPTYTSQITVSSTTTIKAGAWETGMNPSAIATATYTIYTPVLTSITVSPSTATLTKGSTQTFTAQPLDQFGNPISATITWSSSNTAVGTITSDGLFTALAAGSTTITASNGSVSGTASVTVKNRRKTAIAGQISASRFLLSDMLDGNEY